MGQDTRSVRRGSVAPVGVRKHHIDDGRVLAVRRNIHVLGRDEQAGSVAPVQNPAGDERARRAETFDEGHHGGVCKSDRRRIAGRLHELLLDEMARFPAAARAADVPLGAYGIGNSYSAGGDRVLLFPQVRTVSIRY